MPPPTWKPVKPNPEALAALDPYREWAQETNYAYYAYRDGRSVDWVPVIIELQQITAQAFAVGKWNPPSRWQDWLWIPPLYARPPAGLEHTRFCTANVMPMFYKELAERGSPLSKVVKRVALSLFTPSTAPQSYAPKNLPQGIAPPGMVVTGIIDDGLAFANDRFRLGQQTRIEYIWNQDAPMGGVPGGVLYGREILKHDAGAVLGIDTLMANAKHGGALMAEEEVYRASKHIEYTLTGHKPVAQRGAHGTHVMDAACGYDSATAPADRPIIGVQLPVATTAESSGALLAAPVLCGMRYIVDRADQFAVREGFGPLPIVVNLSYGYIAGPHDGSSILEAAIDELITLRRTVAPMSVVLPAGNSHLARCHARFTLAHDEQQPPLHWRIQPDDGTPSFMELWLPQLWSGHAKVAVRVNPPGAGNTSPWIHEGELYEWRPKNDVLCKVIYFNAVAAGRPRNMVFIAVASTATLHPTAELAPAGRWEIQVKNVGHAATFDAWIQRDDTPYGYPVRGRQSRFDDRHYNYRDPISGRKLETDTPASYVKRKGAINAMATGRETVVIGGFHRKEWSAAPYSAAGPIIEPPGVLWPHRLGPDAMSVSEDSVVHHGLLAAGTQSNSLVAMTGTSVAAPQIARWTADRMANGQQYGRQAVFHFAQTGVAPGYRTEANPPPGAAPQPPIRRSGGGRIEAPPIVDRKIER